MQKISSSQTFSLGIIAVFLFTLILASPAAAGLNDLTNLVNKEITDSKDSSPQTSATVRASGSDLSGIFSSSGNGGGTNLFSGIFDGFKNIFSGVTGFFKNLFGGNNSGGGGITGFFSGLIDSFKNIFSNTPGKNSTGITDTDSGTTPPGNETPSTETPTPPPAGTSGGKGGKALLGWLQQAGLTGENLKMAWSISMGESGGNPRAFNGNSRTGDKSYGLFQINMIGSMGPARRREFGISSNEELFNPLTNIKAMLKVSNNCRNWRPWSVYKSGAYKKYYNQYPPR